MSSDSPLPAVYVAGLNQSQKQIKGGMAKTAFVAKDAEQRLINLVEGLCRENNVAFDSSHTMEELGRLCGIEVGCAVCVSLS